MSKETWARMSKKEKAAFVKALQEYPPHLKSPLFPGVDEVARVKGDDTFQWNLDPTSRRNFNAAMDDAAHSGTGFVRIVGPESVVHIKRGEVYLCAIPEPYYYSLPVWIWKRLTRWRDAYGRKAQLFPFPWFDWNPL